MKRGYLNSIFWIQYDESGVELVLKGVIAEKSYFVFSEFEPFKLADTQYITELSVELKEAIRYNKSSDSYQIPERLQKCLVSYIDQRHTLNQLLVNLNSMKVEQVYARRNLKHFIGQQDKAYCDIQRVSKDCVRLRTDEFLIFNDTRTSSTFKLSTQDAFFHQWFEMESASIKIEWDSGIDYSDRRIMQLSLASETAMRILISYEAPESRKQDLIGSFGL